MPHPSVNDSPEYRVPGVSPLNYGIVPFSAQRFCPPVVAPQHDDVPESSRQSLVVVDSIGVVSTIRLPVLVGDVVFTPVAHF